jgi:uncharacterized membrane protein YdbT with pleckstrin-like domain
VEGCRPGAPPPGDLRHSAYNAGVALKERLVENESIVFESKKHWMAPIRDSLIAVLLLIGAYLLGWVSPSDANGVIGGLGNILDWIKIGLVIVAAAMIVYNIVAWRTAEFAVTNMRVLREEGLLSHRSSTTIITSVTDVKTRIPLLGRGLGFGDIAVVTQSGEAGADKFKTITQPEGFRDAVMNRNLAGPIAAAAPAPAAEDNPPPPEPGA